MFRPSFKGQSTPDSNIPTPENPGNITAYVKPGEVHTKGRETKGLTVERLSHRVALGRIWDRHQEFSVSNNLTRTSRRDGEYT